MKMLIRNIKIVLVLFLLVSSALLAGLIIQQHRSKNQFAAAAGENRAGLKARYANAGTVFARDGGILAQSKNGKRIYSQNADVAKAVLHVVGDYTHHIGNTVEADYQGQLLGTDRNPLHQLFLDISGHGLEGDDITLTLDPGLSVKSYQLLKGRKGAVVLINYRTGAVLASVSSPSTSPNSVIVWRDIPDTALFDRAFMGAYAPGSTFKLVTAAAWMDSPSFDVALEVDCGGKSTVVENGADETTKGHGRVRLEEAFSKSCNVFFGQVGVLTGKDELLAKARDFGIGDVISVDRLGVRTSQIKTVDQDPATLSWLAIGQPNEFSTLRMSPLQMALMAGAVGNEGAIPQPHIIDHLTDPLGTTYQQLEPGILKQVMDKASASRLEALMMDATLHGTASPGAVKGFSVAGKTGTVQVEEKKNNALYVGYIKDEKFPYAIAVVVEEGGSGGKAAAPIAALLLKAAAQIKGG